MRQNENTVVETKSGKIQGIYEEGLYVFKGIPYAAAPVKQRRWLPPEPVEHWSGVRPAQTFGTIAPQTSMQMNIMRQQYEEEPQSEDCLYLNVWSPGLDDSRRAVLVWIHGGAFSMGSGSSPMHPGSTLPKRGDVVTVTINYRLGPLGFLHLKETTEGRIPATGNEGLLDQITALQWVHDNIAAFGGDSENVTVFGESAGAMSIGCLLAMPKARGLFQKTILQSGANTVRPLGQAIKVAEKFLEILGVSHQDVNALRSLPVERLLSAQQELGSAIQRQNIKGAPTQPVVDEDTLPELPLDAIKSGSADNVVVLAGSNLEEAKLFAAMDQSLTNLGEAGLVRRVQRLLPPKYATELIESYRNARTKRDADTSPAEILMAIQTDIQFRIPDVRLIEAQCSQNLPAYNYLFTWKSPVPGLGACHALDVGFIFGTLNEEFHGSGPAAERLVRNMQDAWIAFARTGNPSCESLGNWPTYGNERKTMILGEECRVEDAPYEDERSAWDPIPSVFLG